MQYVQTGIYSTVRKNKIVFQAKMGSTACSTQYGAVYAHDMNIHNANSIGGNNMSAPIYWRRRIHILNRRGGPNLHSLHSFA